MDAQPNENATGLRRLGEIPGYEVPPGEPDLRGWRVETPEGRELGVVVELLVEPTTMRPRFLEVLAEGATEYSVIPADDTRLESDRHTIVTEAELPGLVKRAEDVEEERTPMVEAMVGGDVVGELGAGQIHIPIVEGEVPASEVDAASAGDVEVSRPVVRERVLLDTAEGDPGAGSAERVVRPDPDRDPDLPGR